ncbi:MAG: FlxA-like family protein [Alphaproteobacteria bacterium]|nr:FlxA-like family protein [Alphaproteobacteria bacterium]
MTKPVMNIYENPIELTKEEKNLINVILSGLDELAPDTYLRNDLEAHFDVLYSEYAFSTWVRRMRMEVKKVHGYDLDDTALMANYRKNVNIQPKMLDMFRNSRTKCQERLKEIKSNKGMTLEEKAKKEAHINEIIKNLNESIARQLAVKSTYVSHLSK